MKTQNLKDKDEQDQAQQENIGGDKPKPELEEIPPGK